MKGSMSGAPRRGISQRPLLRAVEERRRDPRADLPLGLEEQFRVACADCGWSSRWFTRLDLARAAFAAHQQARHREGAPGSGLSEGELPSLSD